MNRRNFLKFAAIAGVAGVFGLPEVEADELDLDCLSNGLNDVGVKAKEAADVLTSLSDLIYVDIWPLEKRKRIAREIIELEKQLPGILPTWEDEEIAYSTQSGTHWPNDEKSMQVIDLDLDEDDMVVEVVVDDVTGNIYLGTYQGRAFTSRNNGNTFSELRAGDLSVIVERYGYE